MNKVTLMLVAILLTIAGMATPANAGTHNHYQETASWVAKYEVDCKNFKQTPDGSMYLDAGVCNLKGNRVNVITFEGPRQQAAWTHYVVKSFGPRFCWAQSKGAVIVAKGGSRDAALVGAEALKGKVRHA